MKKYLGMLGYMTKRESLLHGNGMTTILLIILQSYKLVLNIVQLLRAVSQYSGVTVKKFVSY